MSFDAIFKSLEKSAKEDPHSTAYRAGSVEIPSTVPFGILSGIPRLDLTIGRPGLPAGRVVEAYGFERSGKTTFALHVLAQAQKVGGGGLFIDGEQSFDEDRATEIGVDPYTNFAVSSVETIEGVFRQMDAALKGIAESGFDKPFVIIVDSITGVSSELEKGKEYGSVARVGEDARVIRTGMRKIVPDIAKTKACVIFINHAISKVAATPYAKQSESSGGHAIKFFSSLRCNFTNAGDIKDKEKNLLGQKINIRIEKLKRAKLRRTEIKEIHLLTDTGFDLTDELFQAGLDFGMVERVNMKTYSFNDKQFAKSDWPQMVEDLGGAQKFYEQTIEWAKEKGIIRDWGEKLYG